MKELLAKTTTKLMVRPTHALIEKTRNELVNIGASIKTTYTESPKGTKFGYVAEIITYGEYRNIFTAPDSTWVFLKPINLATYYPSIKTSTSEVTKSKK